MDELIRDHLLRVISLLGIVIAGVIVALYKIGWLKVGQKDTEEIPTNRWNGHERRECAQHSALNQKVCALYTKLEDVDKKLDTVAEKLQYILGALENRWGQRI